jgi:hypothetical protein
VKDLCVVQSHPCVVALRSLEPNLPAKSVVADCDAVPSREDRDRDRESRREIDHAGRVLSDHGEDEPPRRRSDRGRDNESDDNRDDLGSGHGGILVERRGKVKGEGKRVVQSRPCMVQVQPSRSQRVG